MTAKPAAGGKVAVGATLSSGTGYLVWKLGDAASATFEESLAPLGLRARHVRTLAFVDDQEPSQRDLCRLTGLDRTTMVAVVDELERRGFVRRDRSETDRRKHVIVATAAGRATLTGALDRLRRAESDFFAPLSKAERRAFHDMAARLFAVRDPSCRAD